MKSKDYVKLYREAHEFESERYEQYTELMAFYQGNQYQLEQYAVDKPWVVQMNTSYASEAIDTRTASLMASDYVGRLEPLSQEDVEKVRSLQYVYEHFWKSMNMDNLINDSILRCAIVREAYVHIIYDPKKIKGGTNRMNKGDLKAYFLNPASVLIDPKALDLKDARYLIVTGRITREEAIELYPNVIEKPVTDGEAGSMSPYERGELFVENDYDTHQEDVLTKMTVYRKVKDQIEKTILIDEKIVEKPVMLDLTVFPVAQLRWEPKAQSPYGISLMDRLLAPQKAVNTIESAIVNTAISFSAPTLVVRKGSGIDPRALAKVAGSPGVVLSVSGDPKTAVSTIVTPKIDQQMVEIKRENEATIKRMAGLSEQFTGNIGSAGNTSGGTDQAIARSKVIEFKFLVNMEKFVEDLTQIVIEYVTTAFDGKTLYGQGKRNSDGSYNFESVKMDESFKDVEYSFSIDLEVRTQYSREREKQMMIEMYQLEQQYDAPVKTINIKDILQAYDVTNQEELVNRYDHLVKNSAQQKSQIIEKMTSLAHEFQVDQGLLTQAISEIIGDDKEQKSVQALMQSIEQKQLAVQQMEQQMQEIEQEDMAEKMGQIEQADMMGGGPEGPPALI